MARCVMCGATDGPFMDHSVLVFSVDIGPFKLTLDYVKARTCLDCGMAYAEDDYLDAGGEA